MFDPRRILATLNRHQVDYVLIGGVAATLYACPEQTFDLDILYADTPENRRRLLTALAELEAQWEEPLTETVLCRQPVFALNTNAGDLDIFSQIPGVDSFATAAARRQWMRLGNETVPVLDLATLIQTKEAAGDPNPRKRAALDFLRELARRSTY